MPSSPRFDVPAPILKDESNPKWTFHYVPIPTDVAEVLLQSGTRRVIVTVAGKQANRSLHQNADGEYRLIMGLDTVRMLGHVPGDVMLMTLHSDPYPDSVDVPAVFLEALDDHPEAKRRFDAWTPGKKRSAVSYITQAKKEETRIRRAYEFAYKMETYTLHGDKKPTD